MGMIKKIKNFIFYKNLISKHKMELETRFNIKIDWIYRLYTIYSLNNKDYKTYKEYNYDPNLDLLEAGAKKFLKEVDVFLKTIKLTELYGLRGYEKIDDNNIKIIIGFKEFDTLKYANIAVSLLIIILLGSFISLGVLLSLLFI
jgi:hypothetical protein